MAMFEIRMQHTEESLTALSHMQYDLFCRSNRIARSLLSVGLIILGVMNSDSWWSILLIFYGCYLSTTTYASSNRTARKISEQIRAAGLPFPGSVYSFTENGIQITPLSGEAEDSDFLPYSKVCEVGEDLNYYYIFRDHYGGYMFSKDALGKDATEFRDFVEKKTGKAFMIRRFPLSTLLARLRLRNNEPDHL